MKRMMSHLFHVALMLLAFTFANPVISHAQQTAVASWVFSEGWESSSSGTVVTYTPDGSGWQAISNTAWKSKQPVFLPNTCSGVQTNYKLSLKTSDGKWEVKQSKDSYVLRLNTASIDKFTQKENYGDASTHDQYFEVNFPTVNPNNVKLNFAIGDGSSSSTHFGVAYSVDGGTTWTTLDDYVSGSHWNTYNDAVYSLDADNKENVIVRLFIVSATKNSNYNLKYVKVLADDHEAPAFVSSRPKDNEDNVVTTGTIALNFDECACGGWGRGNAYECKYKQCCQACSNSNGNVIRFSYSALDKSAMYNFELPANTVSDLSGNVLESLDVQFHHRRYRSDTCSYNRKQESFVVQQASRLLGKKLYRWETVVLVLCTPVVSHAIRSSSTKIHSGTRDRTRTIMQMFWVLREVQQRHLQ